MTITPESIKPHQKDYKPHAWENYSFIELGQWVHLLTMRSLHRAQEDKRQKDIYDAQNYLNMMQSKIDSMK
jgi:hypothetical protein